MNEMRADDRQAGEKREHHKKHDPLSGMTGGLILILLGILFFMAQLDYIHWSNWWAYFLIGLGAIFILESVIRIFYPQYGRRVTGKLIAGAILIVIGAANVFGMVIWWPLILIVVGIFIIINSVQKSDQ
jgi:hypothetical protein